MLNDAVFGGFAGGVFAPGGAVLRAADFNADSSPARMRRWSGVLSETELSAETDAEILEAVIARAEELKSALCAFQVRAAVALEGSVARVEEHAGVEPSQRGVGVAAQIALARKESLHRGKRFLGLAKVLVKEMPHTFGALGQGVVNEWQATLIARETACLCRKDRLRVDRELEADTGGIKGLGTGRIVATARKLAYRCDPASALRRTEKAISQRYVSLRPAPDSMTYLTAFLPVAEGVAVYKALSQVPHGVDQRARQDESAGRTHRQVMADELVHRITGNPRGFSQIEVQLVMTDRTLLEGEPASIPGYRVIPGALARKTRHGR